MTRLFQDVPLSEHQSLVLDSVASHHIGRVLRAAISDTVVIFNGQGGEYNAVITAIDKKNVTVQLQHFNDREVESPLQLYLAQGLSRGEKMDFTIQKAVELGVTKIYPLLTERSNVKLDAERTSKRLQHWRAIIVSACEQSGRNRLPQLFAPLTLTQWLNQCAMDQGYVLAPIAEQKLNASHLAKDARVALVVGPEGGLSPIEIETLTARQFLPLNLGPRILRTETAGLVALTALQCYFGDMVN